jgi:hypothetical protein
MVEMTSILDPVKIPSVTLTGIELDEAEQLIASGDLPADWFQQYYRAVDEAVFGVGFARDAKTGKPVENGLGSPQNQTRQSIEAFRRFGVNEPDFERSLARMERQLAECEQRRAAEIARAPAKRFGRR